MIKIVELVYLSQRLLVKDNWSFPSYLHVHSILTYITFKSMDDKAQSAMKKIPNDVIQKGKKF